MIRVATWNLHMGARLERALAELDAFPRLDLLALQEVSEHGGVEDASAVATRLGPRFRAWQVRAQTLRGLPQANALVWDALRIDLAPAAVLELPGPTGAMLSRLPPTSRNALVAEGCAGRRRLRVAVVHLDVLGLAHKHAQLTHVLDELRRRPAVDLELVAGDLNTYGIAGAVRWSRLRALADRRGLEEMSAGVRWTHSAAGVRQKLDAVFASPAGLPHRAFALPTAASDHRPVVVELDT